MIATAFRKAKQYRRRLWGTLTLLLRDCCGSLAKLTVYPQHSIFATALIAIGSSMLGERQPFVWPPYLMEIGNDHGFDMIFIILGVMMFAWIFSKEHHEEWDAINLGMASFFMTTLTLYQCLHWLHTGMSNPWVQNAVITVLIYVLARRGGNNDDDDYALG